MLASGKTLDGKEAHFILVISNNFYPLELYSKIEAELREEAGKFCQLW